MPWQTASFDPRVSWHWTDSHSIDATTAVCGYRFGKHKIIGSADAVRGRMKACQQCVRKLARRASVDPPTETT